jgi:SAM-dependent methyltransferase
VQAEYSNPERQRAREQLTHQIARYDLDAELERTILEEEPATVLDIGCGIGEQAARLAQRGLTVQGIDVAPAMVEAAKARGVAAQVADAASLPFPNASFERVLARYVLYHVSAVDLGGIMEEIVRVLTPGGRLVAATISQSFMDTVAGYLGEANAPKASFTLENGPALLENYFGSVSRVALDGTLHFASGLELRDYLRGTVSWGQVADHVSLVDNPIDIPNPIAVFTAEK